jgi:hypothetical protein
VFYQLSKYEKIYSIFRENTFIMPRGGGMKMLRGGGHRNILFYSIYKISGIKGEALKVLDILKGGGGSKLFKVLVQQGPGMFTPTIVNRWFGNSPYPIL